MPLVFASDVGAACGYNPYCSAAEVAAKLKGAPLPKDVDSIDAAALKLACAELAVPAASSHSAEAMVAHLAAPLAATSTRADLEAAEAALKRKLTSATSMGPAVSAAITSASVSTAYKARGTRDEIPALELYSQKFCPAVGGDAVFRKKAVFKGLAVGGKEDGRHADGSAILEIKRRQKGFFDRVPMRELAQLYVYMFVTGVRQGVVVQAFDGDIRREVVTWDDAVWARIVADLRTFYTTYFCDE